MAAERDLVGESGGAPEFSFVFSSELRVGERKKDCNDDDNDDDDDNNNTTNFHKMTCSRSTGLHVRI